MDAVTRAAVTPQELEALVASEVIARVSAKSDITALEVARILRVAHPDKEILYGEVKHLVFALMQGTPGYTVNYGQFKTWVPIPDPVPDPVNPGVDPVVA